MNETEWMACDDPVPMLEFLEGKTSDRKLRLFGVLCCRQNWDLFPDDLFRDAILLAEQGAEGTVDEGELAAVDSAIFEYADGVQGLEDFCFEPARLLDPRHRYTYTTADAVWCSRNNAVAEWCSRNNTAIDQYHGKLPVDGIEAKMLTEQAALLHDIFGNPFRPVAADPRWLTSTVRGLATAIYAERAFDRLPILADALEDAGCDHADVLAHCRGDGPHVRGCWVVDLILGKS